MTISEIYSRFKTCNGVTTDTRTLKGGEMFFALKGENFDGNEYALKALEAGASYAVVNLSAEVAAVEDERLIKVEDTLKTLQELARWHRSMTFVGGRPLPVVALTGTNGKTTTKELVRQVLSVKHNVTATEGNLNNSIGVPLTLLKINPSTEIAVVEMGASHPGDIKELVDIALPNFGLITNVGKAHLLGFGSFEGVKATKGELYDYLRRTSDKVFLNVDNPHLCQMASERNLQSDPERPYSLVLPYGLSLMGAEVLPSDAEHPFLRIRLQDRIVNTNLVGSYNADNVMAAIAVGQHFGVSLDEAVDLVLFAFEHGTNGDILVQKAPACTIQTQAEAICELFGGEKNNIKVIGIRHGEKMYETLLTNEECAKAEDMGDFYRVPADNRGLNYDKYFVEGNTEERLLHQYNSHNTERLDVAGTIAKMKTTDYIKEELAKLGK